MMSDTIAEYLQIGNDPSKPISHQLLWELTLYAYCKERIYTVSPADDLLEQKDNIQQALNEWRDMTVETMLRDHSWLLIMLDRANIIKYEEDGDKPSAWQLLVNDPQIQTSLNVRNDLDPRQLGMYILQFLHTIRTDPSVFELLKQSAIQRHKIMLVEHDKKLKKQREEDLQRDSRVVIVGLRTRQDLNNKRGTVRKATRKKNQWIVQVDDKESYKLSSGRLRNISRQFSSKQANFVVVVDSAIEDTMKLQRIISSIDVPTDKDRKDLESVFANDLDRLRKLRNKVVKRRNVFFGSEFNLTL